MITKEQANKLAEMIRETPVESSSHVLWAVQYHLALFVWGLEKAETCLENLIISCNSSRADNLLVRFGLEGLESLPETLVELNFNNRIRIEESNDNP